MVRRRAHDPARRIVAPAASHRRTRRRGGRREARDALADVRGAAQHRGDRMTTENRPKTTPAPSDDILREAIIRNLADFETERGVCGWRKRLITSDDTHVANVSHLMIDDSKEHWHETMTEI